VVNDSQGSSAPSAAALAALFDTLCRTVGPKSETRAAGADHSRVVGGSTEKENAHVLEMFFDAKA
jgi:hypothetical protein